MTREIILNRLEADIVGPLDEHELIGARPSDTYLSGILWPSEERMGAEEDDRLGAGSTDDDSGSPASEEEEVSIVGLKRPCSAGLSFAVGSTDGEPVVNVTLRFGTYFPEEEASSATGARAQLRWRRQAHDVRFELRLVSQAMSFDLANAPSAIKLESRTPHRVPIGTRIHVRTAPWDGKCLVTVTVINAAKAPEAAGRVEREQITLFQVELEVRPGDGTRLIPRPSRRAVVDDEDRSAALLYRHAHEYAVGHTCSATWTTNVEGSSAECVVTTWVPKAIVPAVSSSGHAVFANIADEATKPLSAEWLAKARSDELDRGLLRVVDAYRRWISERESEIAGLPAELRDAARTHLDTCTRVAVRMEEGARLVSGTREARLAFQLANRAMLIQYEWDPERRSAAGLNWRPFQLGFFLLCVSSLADRDHVDRGTMDLLWFPTGGGKTEAYLALIAFLAFQRRLSSNGRPDAGAGVAALMRYTLRLLTTQQFSRAAAVVLACEALRRGSVAGVPSGADLGTTPFSIGLWVGGDATPNSFDTALRSLQGDPEPSSPRQLLNCPACQTPLVWEAVPRDRTVHVSCRKSGCVLNGGSEPLPVWTVDEDVYRKKPTLVIGTVDKFAQIVRRSEINELFSVRTGLPPDLIIQDELHLISGPLGTLAGVYEAALDQLFTREGRVPKIIGSTATIRRAHDQVGALFARNTCQFPPPGLDAGDSGFAVVDKAAPGRLYAAITTAGRSAKFTLQGAAASLLQSAGAAFASPATADPYWTLVAYFNSLRELGGALVLMQDDVADSIAQYARRRGEQDRVAKAVEELTSRRTQLEIRDMLQLLAKQPQEDGALDAVLATNMVSVGVDVPRLGLMLVNGQPKGIAEYIQATSRVGRRHPGLVVAVLNNAKARDRSHYETFWTWHETLYRDVEATSVTPFASRARDRALHAALVAAVRHLVPGMLDKPDIAAADPDILKRVVDELVNRAKRVDSAEGAVAAELEARIAAWQLRAPNSYWNDMRPRDSLLQSAERAATMQALGRSPGEAWPTLNSMRNVEPATPFRLAERLRTSPAREEGEGHGE